MSQPIKTALDDIQEIIKTSKSKPKRTWDSDIDMLTSLLFDMRERWGDVRVGSYLEAHLASVQRNTEARKLGKGTIFHE